VVAIAGLATLSVLGTLGYVLIERASVLDALFMTITTISTVGYGEVVPLSPAGRVFTIVLIIVGVGNALYLFTAAAELLVEGRLRDFLGRRVMERKMEQLNGHVIICGYGRFGRVVASELARAEVRLVVIDSDPAKQVEIDQAGLPSVIGSALSDAVLERAGIRRARAIVVGTGSDSDNVFITLSARETNPSIGIHARGESDGGMRRLRLAGANQVISAYHMGGLRMAASILRPSVVDFLEISAPGRGDPIDLEEIGVGRGCAIEGRKVSAIEAEVPRLRVVALKRGEEPIRLIPDPTLRVEVGDYLVVIGDRAGLARLAQLAQEGARS
jgi:voltage-gated potassium channel